MGDCRQSYREVRGSACIADFTQERDHRSLCSSNRSNARDTSVRLRTGSIRSTIERARANAEPSSATRVPGSARNSLDRAGVRYRKSTRAFSGVARRPPSGRVLEAEEERRLDVMKGHGAEGRREAPRPRQRHGVGHRRHLRDHAVEVERALERDVGRERSGQGTPAARAGRRGPAGPTRRAGAESRGRRPPGARAMTLAWPFGTRRRAAASRVVKTGASIDAIVERTSSSVMAGLS